MNLFHASVFSFCAASISWNRCFVLKFFWSFFFRALFFSLSAQAAASC
jgi:hypothetical protein